MRQLKCYGNVHGYADSRLLEGSVLVMNASMAANCLSMEEIKAATVNASAL